MALHDAKLPRVFFYSHLYPTPAPTYTPRGQIMFTSLADLFYVEENIVVESDVLAMSRAIPHDILSAAAWLALW